MHDIILEYEIDKFVSEELLKRFLLPISIDKVIDIPFAEAHSIHIVKQSTIDKNGNESIKHYPCHNLYYNPKRMNNSSIKDRIIEDKINSI